MKLFVVQSQVDLCRAFFPYQFFYFRIIVSLVFSSENQYRFSSHTLQGIPARVYIGCFGVIDKINATYACHLLQAVFYPLKVTERFPYIFFGDTGKVGGDTGG